MSNTIQVENGDVWTMLIGSETANVGMVTRLFQYRNGANIRSIGRNESLTPEDTSRFSGEIDVDRDRALAVLKHWGYTITTPAAKDEAPAKTEPTPDVPMVGDIWVEHDGVLSGYSQWNKMHALHGYEIRNGTARIVRLAPDADLAATVKRVEERLAKLEAATTAEVRHVRSEMIVGGDCTRAKVLVVAPKTNQWVTDDSKAVEDGRDWQWIDTLMRQGIDVVKEAGK